MEIMVIAMIALIVLGPSRLPEAARSLGKGLREMRDSFQGNDDDEDDDDDDGEDDDARLDADLDDDDGDDLVDEDDEDEDVVDETEAPQAEPVTTAAPSR